MENHLKGMRQQQTTFGMELDFQKSPSSNLIGRSTLGRSLRSLKRWARSARQEVDL